MEGECRWKPGWATETSDEPPGYIQAGGGGDLVHGDHGGDWEKFPFSGYMLRVESIGFPVRFDVDVRGREESQIHSGFRTE